MKEMQIQKLQAKQLRLMRSGAKFFINKGMNDGEISDLLADVDLKAMEADQRFSDWSQDQVVDMRNQMRNIYMNSADSARVKLSSMLEDVLQYDLDNGVVRVETIGHDIDYLKGLTLKLEHGLKELYQSATDINKSILRELSFDAEIWSVLAERGRTPEGFSALSEMAPASAPYIEGCSILARQLSEAKATPGRLRELQQHLIKDELEPIRRAGRVDAPDLSL